MLKLVLPLTLVLGLLLSGSAVSAGIIYSGELTWDPTEAQIDAEGSWANPATKVEWAVEKIGADEWSYTYVFTFPDKEVSHLIIETSENLSTLDNVLCNFPLEKTGGNPFEFQWFESLGPGQANPDIPDTMYGVKFSLAQASTYVEIRFTAERDPIWGDFYAKSGVDGGDDVTAFNTGFTPGDADPDPFVFGPDSEAVTDHILVPDTIPEPTVLVVISLGGAIMLARRR